MRRLARELSPSIRRIWFDDRSKCCRFRRWPSPSILAMRLPCTLSVCRSELSESSSKLRRKGTCHQPGSFIPGPLYLPPRPTTAAASPRPEGPAPRAGCSGAPAPPASSSPPNALIHEAELAGDVAVARHTAASPARAATSLQTSLASQRRRAVLYGCGTKPSRQPRRKAIWFPPPRSLAWRTRRRGGGGVVWCGAALRSPRGGAWGLWTVFRADAVLRVYSSRGWELATGSERPGLALPRQGPQRPCVEEGLPHARKPWQRFEHWFSTCPWACQLRVCLVKSGAPSGFWRAGRSQVCVELRGVFCWPRLGDLAQHGLLAQPGRASTWLWLVTRHWLLEYN